MTDTPLTQRFADALRHCQDIGSFWTAYEQFRPQIEACDEETKVALRSIYLHHKRRRL